MKKLADIRNTVAFKQLQNKGFVPIKFHFRDTYSWGGGIYDHTKNNH